MAKKLTNQELNTLVSIICDKIQKKRDLLPLTAKEISFIILSSH